MFGRSSCLVTEFRWAVSNCFVMKKLQFVTVVCKLTKFVIFFSFFLLVCCLQLLLFMFYRVTDPAKRCFNGNTYF